MSIPSSSETPEESAVTTSPSVRVPVITRSPIGASSTSVTDTATSMVSDSRSPNVEAVTVRVMLGSVSKSRAASSLTVIAQVSASMSKWPSSSPAVIAQLSVVSSMEVADQTLSPDANCDGEDDEQVPLTLRDNFDADPAPFIGVGAGALALIAGLGLAMRSRGGSGGDDDYLDETEDFDVEDDAEEEEGA